MLNHDLAVSQFILDAYAAAKNGLQASLFIRLEDDGYYYVSDGAMLLRIGAQGRRPLSIIHNVLFTRKAVKEYGIARGELVSPQVRASVVRVRSSCGTGRALCGSNYSRVPRKTACVRYGSCLPDALNSGDCAASRLRGRAEGRGA